MHSLLAVLLLACATPPEAPAQAPPAQAPAVPAEPEAPPPPPPAPPPAQGDAAELLERIQAPDAPERQCTVDADCALVKLTCCVPQESVHRDHAATFDLARDNPMCQRVRCRQPPERVAKCLEQRCTAVSP